MRTTLLVIFLVMFDGCASTSVAQRDPRVPTRSAQMASNTHADFEPHQLRERPGCDHAVCEAR